jgi:hypothetical protein
MGARGHYSANYMEQPVSGVGYLIPEFTINYQSACIYNPRFSEHIVVQSTT